MLQQEEPDDFVLATGETHTVREFVEWAFAEVGTQVEWKGAWVDEKWYDTKTGKCILEVDPRYFRPAEVDLLLGDATKAEAKLGWEREYTIAQMVSEMVKSDIELYRREEILKKHGYDILEKYE